MRFQVGKRKRSKVLPSQSMPENVAGKLPPSQSNYQISVEHPMIEQSAALFQKVRNFLC